MSNLPPMTPERRQELRYQSQRMMESTAVVAPYSISPAEVLELLDAEQNQFYLRGNQLAAISTVLKANTPITLINCRLPSDHSLYTAAFRDAVDAMEREIKLIADNAKLRGMVNVLADRLGRLTGRSVLEEISRSQSVAIEEQADANLS